MNNKTYIVLKDLMFYVVTIILICFIGTCAIKECESGIKRQELNACKNEMSYKECMEYFR